MSPKQQPIRRSLDGGPAIHASSMRCGVCMCGDLIGVDFHDRGGDAFAHGHLEIDKAEQFHREYGEAIAEARARHNPS